MNEILLSILKYAMLYEALHMHTAKCNIMIVPQNTLNLSQLLIE